MQRFQLFDENGNPTRGARPEVWTYNHETDERVRIAENAMFPRWVP
ncbi:MAG: hypothetical protein AAF125_19060 [Chloroflexota bacterium]